MKAPRGFRGAFRTDAPARAAYSEGAGPYRIVPAAVAVPLDTDDLLALVRHAIHEEWSLVPRGAGSGMPGGNVGRGVIVDLQRFDRAPSMTGGEVWTGSAVLSHALDSFLAPHGLRLPPDPSSARFCTLGGMVATNAAGARSLRFGPARPWVSAVEFVSGDGERYRLVRGEAAAGGQRFREMERALHDAADLIRLRYPSTRKNTAGYALDAYIESGDLLDLVIGSEGSLGFITEVRWRTAPRPIAVTGALIGVQRLEDLSPMVEHLLPFDPAALEMLDASYLALAGERCPVPTEDIAAILLLDFERDSLDRAAAAARDAVSATVPWTAFAQTALTEPERGALWALRHAASPALAALPDSQRSLQIVEDGCVPIATLGAYVRGVRDIARTLDMDIVAFGHAGDGHLHVNALVDIADADFVSRLQTLYDRVSALVISLGGTPSGEHGDGRLRAPLLERLYGDEIVDLFRRVKSTFDPHGVMNPGVILADRTASPLRELKVGPDAAPVSADLAAALRKIERSGGWATSKLDLPGGP